LNDSNAHRRTSSENALPKRERDDKPELTWSVWPAEQKPHLAAAVAALILGVSWYGYVGFGHVIYSIIALVALTASLANFFFPSAYTLDANGVHLKGFLSSKHRAWEDLACYLVGDDFIAISTTEEPTHRSISHGFILRLRYNNDEVLSVLSRYLTEWRRPADDIDGEDRPE